MVVVGVGVTTTNPVPTLAKMRIVSSADETIIVAVAVFVFVRHEWTFLVGIIFGWEGARVALQVVDEQIFEAVSDSLLQ